MATINTTGRPQHTGNGGEVVLDKVTKIYEGEGTRQVALEDCTLRIEKGKLTVLMGPSGCGKTVLII